MKVAVIVSEFIDKMKNFQELILKFINSENKEQSVFYLNQFKELSDSHQIRKDKEELKILLRLIVSVSVIVHRPPNFFPKIEQLLKLFLKDIKKYYSNAEIFQIFKLNKRVLLFLYAEEIFIPDVLNIEKFFQIYFFPEFKIFYNEKLCQEIITKAPEVENFQLFAEKRKSGENEDFLCKLIREDSVAEFITYVSKENISSSSTIKQSPILETNLYLRINDSPTLIEYSAFYGSIQIFQYLRLNGAELDPSLWLYAIHGNNPDLIHLLEEFHVKPENNGFSDCVSFSIQCHNFEFMNYFLNNLENDGNPYFYRDCVEFFNFIALSEIKENEKNESQLMIDLFALFCEFGYLSVVLDIIKNTDVDLWNKKVTETVFKLFFKKILFYYYYHYKCCS
ncbi:hypothetical protein M9Y10_040383 [Tritrichomonas musculus]|uniref:DUF3447 domain-containing protein n=1 Tax=Tritrichomonas musculus TaxID=1915356 RepID=A0ABR2GRH2_9EUKA